MTDDDKNFGGSEDLVVQMAAQFGDAGIFPVGVERTRDEVVPVPQIQEQTMDVDVEITVVPAQEAVHETPEVHVVVGGDPR